LLQTNKFLLVGELWCSLEYESYAIISCIC